MLGCGAGGLPGWRVLFGGSVLGDEHCQAQRRVRSLDGSCRLSQPGGDSIGGLAPWGRACALRSIAVSSSLQSLAQAKLHTRLSNCARTLIAFASCLPSVVGCSTAFTIHGLWPEYANGGWPEFCGDHKSSSSSTGGSSSGDERSSSSSSSGSNPSSGGLARSTQAQQAGQQQQAGAGQPWTPTAAAGEQQEGGPGGSGKAKQRKKKDGDAPSPDPQPPAPSPAPQPEPEEGNEQQRCEWPSFKGPGVREGESGGGGRKGGRSPCLIQDAWVYAGVWAGSCTEHCPVCSLQLPAWAWAVRLVLPLTLAAFSVSSCRQRLLGSRV